MVYNDPTGHSVDCSILDTACKEQVHAENANNYLQNLVGIPTTPSTILKPPVPDAGGLRVSATGGMILGVDASFDFLYNWRSNEFNIFFSLGGKGYVNGGDLSLNLLVGPYARSEKPGL